MDIISSLDSFRRGPKGWNFCDHSPVVWSPQIRAAAGGLFSCCDTSATSTTGSSVFSYFFLALFPLLTSTPWPQRRRFGRQNPALSSKSSKSSIILKIIKTVQLFWAKFSYNSLTWMFRAFWGDSLIKPCLWVLVHWLWIGEYGCKIAELVTHSRCNVFAREHLDMSLAQSWDVGLGAGFHMMLDLWQHSVQYAATVINAYHPIKDGDGNLHNRHELASGKPFEGRQLILGQLAPRTVSRPRIPTIKNKLDWQARCSSSGSPLVPAVSSNQDRPSRNLVAGGPSHRCNPRWPFICVYKKVPENLKENPPFWTGLNRYFAGVYVWVLKMTPFLLGNKILRV